MNAGQPLPGWQKELFFLKKERTAKLPSTVNVDVQYCIKNVVKQVLSLFGEEYSDPVSIWLKPDTVSMLVFWLEDRV